MYAIRSYYALESHWYFVYPVGKQLSVAARAFMDFARAEAKGLALLNGVVRRPS